MLHDTYVVGDFYLTYELPFGGELCMYCSYTIHLIFPSHLLSHPIHPKYERRIHNLPLFKKASIKPVVELSWLPVTLPASSSVRIFLARTLPNSTPH
jgi:hypothetical protein